MNHYLSIDIGGTNIKHALIDGSGKIISKSETPTPNKDRESFLVAIDEIISAHAGEIRAVVFSCPGKIDSATGTIYYGGALPFLHEFGMAAYVEEKFGLPCSLINDGKAAALAELWLGQLKDVKNGAAMTFGTGIGGGLVLNKVLHEGSHFLAGELSYMVMDTTAPLNVPKIAGMRGSAFGFIQTAGAMLGLEAPCDGRHIFEELKKGNETIYPLFEQYCREIALVIMNMQTVVDVERVAIGGGISAQELFIEEIQKQYEIVRTTITEIAFLPAVEIVACTFRNEAGLLGALYNYLVELEGPLQ